MQRRITETTQMHVMASGERWWEIGVERRECSNQLCGEDGEV